jgi:hypothetical protein
MDVPPVEELPFFDEAVHDSPTESEKRDRGDAYGAYLKNVRSGTKPGEE